MKKETCIILLLITIYSEAV